MKRTRKTDGSDKVHLKKKRTFFLFVFLQIEKIKLSFAVKVTEILSHFHRKRPSPPHSHMSMTNRQRVAKVSQASVWTSPQPSTKHPRVKSLPTTSL